MVQRPTDLVAKALDYRNDIKLALTNIDIAKLIYALPKSVSKPSLSGFYSYSSRISYADRLVQTNTFDLVEVGVVESTGESVVRPVYNQRVVAASRLKIN